VEEWKDGTLDDWVEKKVFPLSGILPTFHYSRIIFIGF
jgi:hypothetical protein